MSSPFASTRGRGRGRASHGRARGEIFCGRGRGEASRRGRGGEEFALAGERGHARGRGRGNARSRGRRDVSIGRGRGAHISNNGQEDRLSLREHANASSIPLHRRHRIYLPIDDSSSQAPAPLSGQQNDAEQGPTENNLHPPPNQVLDNPDSDVVMNGAESSHRWRGHVRTASLSNAGRSSWQQEAREQTPSLSLEETSAITAWTEAVAPGAQFESGPWESEPASQGSTAMNPDFEGIGPDDAYPPFVQRFRSSSTAQTATARPEETAASEPVVATLSEQSPALEHGSVLDEIADLLPDAADLIIFDDGEHVAVEEEAENEVEESVHEAGATNSPSSSPANEARPLTRKQRKNKRAQLYSIKKKREARQAVNDQYPPLLTAQSGAKEFAPGEGRSASQSDDLIVFEDDEATVTGGASGGERGGEHRGLD